MAVGFGVHRGRVGQPRAPRESDRVRPGDRFLECGRLQAEWQVDRILQPRGVGRPHAVISNRHRRTDRRVVSCSSLLDPQRFARQNEDVELS